MRPLLRLHALAALLVALGTGSAARAQEAEAPPIWFDTQDDFSQLRGTDPGAPVAIDSGPGTSVGTAPTESEDGKPQRAAPQAPITDEAAEGPAQRKRSSAPDGSDYEPLGIRLGAFILRPAIEFRTGYTSNAAGSPTGGPSGVLAVAPDVSLQSDWSEHQLGFRLKGAYNYYTDTSVAADPTLYVEANGRIDLPDDWALRLKADYDYQKDAITVLGYPIDANNPSGVNTFDGGATLDGSFGRVLVELRGTATYTGYEAATLAGQVIDQSYRDNTLVSGAVRVGYQATPAIAPFVETQLTGRTFAQPIDAFGYGRDSNGITIRGGLQYSADPVLKGEIALGWHRENYVDAAYPSFDAPTIDASLVWSPSPLTQINFVASTSIDPADDLTASSTLVYDLALSAQRYIRENFTIEGDIGWQRQHYIGTDLSNITYEAGIGATWKLNRTAWIVGRLAQEYYASAAPGGDYPTTTATIGLRLQR
ncbi:hypothetical protein GGR25_002612 [Kaistia hirudinis]|uniref:Outer membrane beta-barrel protein n=1 Tax=Kaistia hirudinis TaxID=1293440 RepID=A0A840APK5_9HYPH|nr:outer membrane beta-barrel protein [Kaistia hirudinis]MBB3931562.1 hypothetical protein [Kaistia hirudinis]